MRSFWRWAWVGLVPATTLVLLPFVQHLELGAVLLLHLLAVVAVGVMSTPQAAAVAAVLAVGLVNWYFTVPYHSLRIAHAGTILDLTVFLVVALTTGRLVRQRRHLEAHAERVEEEREHAVELDRSRAALLSALGHDLRTPISTIKATTSGILAKDVSWTADDITDALHLVDEETDRLADLLTNLLDQSRLEAGANIANNTPVEVSELVMAKRLPRVPRQYALPADLPMVVADPGLMERVVHNILINAQRHGGSGADVHISAQRSGERVLLHFDDNGKGLDDVRLQTIFDPYRAAGDRSRGGTGLGLAIVRGFVTAMGGSVEASHSPRGGLRITIALQVAE